MTHSLKKNINMLEGPLLKNIILYTIPIILTGFLQLLFNAADLVIVGQFCGSISVAAVGATNSVTSLIVNLFLGLSAGAGVVMANALGAKDNEDSFRVIHTAMPLALVCGAFLTIVGITVSKPILTLMGTPSDVLPLSATYMKIYFAGIIAMLVYNFGAAILRAAGDTQGPLIYLSIAGVINVALNVMFVTLFDMNVAGVALATTISQIVSAALVVIRLMRRNDAARFYIKKMRFYKRQLIRIINIGVPAGIQSSMFSISNVLIQSSVNSFGSAAVSGAAAASSIENFVFIAMNAFHQTGLNFAGQNAGAGNYKRIKKIAALSLASVSVLGLVGGILVWAFARQLLGIYITNSEEAIMYGITKMTFICLPYFIEGLMDTTTGLLRGIGSSFAPMLITIFGTCVFRVVWIYTVFAYFRTYPLLLISYVISWTITLTVELILFIVLINKKEKRQTATS